MNKKKKQDDTSICSNKKAYHLFEISEKLEVGIILKGYEVKSIRLRHVTLKESYVRIIGDELWLIGCHMTPFSQSTVQDINPARDRKLLAHKREIKRLKNKIDQKGFTIVPIAMYFSHNHVKLTIGVGKSKKMFDKRESLKKKQNQRDMDRAAHRKYN